LEVSNKMRVKSIKNIFIYMEREREIFRIRQVNLTPPPFPFGKILFHIVLTVCYYRLKTSVKPTISVIKSTHSVKKQTPSPVMAVKTL